MEEDIINTIFDLVEIIADPKVRAITYARIGLELFRIEDPRYVTAFRKSFEAAELVEDMRELADLLINIGIYIGETNKNSAIRVFRHVVELVDSLPFQDRDKALEKMIRSMLKLGITEYALPYALLIEDSKIRNEMLFTILKKYLSEGDLKNAIQVSKELLEEPWSSKAKAEILKFHIDKGEIENALEIFNTIEEDRAKLLIEIAGELMKYPEYLSKFLNSLGGDELKEVSKNLLSILIDSPRREYIDLVEEIAGKVADEAIKVKTVAFLNRVGEMEKALKYAKEIKDDYLRSLAFGEVAIAYLKQQDLDRAIEVVMNVKDPRWNSRLLGEILVRVFKLAAEESLEEEH
ncbi:hypothetical protein K1720_10305 [Thermococcus argininiproducens]|uniref:Uncharacterized protein n=1 Tax=Thermococcus argininiproducens TaxID=2866384 RepID=A0A9E7SCJ0_9EURY|nr:hypothetical protein [Thermococcus argininiproducens]USG99859.1 hypothetical protein K1720_10305 [Thermococcus argininiproducens]